MPTLETLRQIAAARTPGPWKWHIYPDGCDEEIHRLGGRDFEHDSWFDRDNPMVLDDGSACGEYAQKITANDVDGKFIVLAENTYDQLLAIAQAAASLMCEDDAQSALSHFVVLQILREKLDALEKIP